MPRQARLDAPGTLHHIIIRGIEGQEIFRDDRDREDFLSRIGQLVEETGTRIPAAPLRAWNPRGNYPLEMRKNLKYPHRPLSVYFP